MTPQVRILIAPYGTRVAVPDDKYAKQLESLDVDIVAYQDEVGVQKSRVDETSASYEGLKKVHDRVAKAPFGLTWKFSGLREKFITALYFPPLSIEFYASSRPFRPGLRESWCISTKA